MGRDGALRIQVGQLRTELGSLQRLADSLRDDMKLDPESSLAFGGGGNPLVYNARLLRNRNRRALYAVDAVIGDLQKLCRDLDRAGRRAGAVFEDTDHNARGGIGRATGD
ncbi:MAG: hypothetical protein ACRDT4_15990 [Micromonosporaceae bacterium]